MLRRSTAPLVEFAVLLSAALAPAAAAQSLPLLAEAHVHAISEEISGDAAYEHVRHNTQFHRPRGGADGLWQVAEYYEGKAREYGLSDVRLIRQAYALPPWNARSAELWIEGERPERIASILQTPLHLADFSRAADVTAELVDAGAGTPAELDAAGVRGKVVLTYGPATAVMREAVVRRGAAGIVWYPSPFYEGTGIDGSGFNRPDQVRWVSLPAGQIDGGEPTFAFVLSLRQGVALRNRLAAAAEPVRVRAAVDAAFTSAQGAEPWQVMVEAFIPGTEPRLGQDVVLTGHMQEEGTSANDDASGTANVLEIGRALTRLIEDGRLPRPRRNIRLWWVTEFSSQRQYFADHPEAHRAMWVNVNQDMVGADQSQDILRKQNVTRLPASRFHFLNDVTEAVVEYMVRANTFELAQLQAGTAALYPRPHLSRLGSRHRYNAEMIFFHGNTDHVPFLEAPIGIPGVTFTNMPDRFIHSSDDDLWNIDPTQLGRNAVAAALIAYAMASADASSAPVLAAEVSGRGGERIARNLGLGKAWIAAATAAERGAAYHRAREQVRYAAARERLAAAPLGEVGGGAEPFAAALRRQTDAREAQALRELEAYWRTAAGSAPPAAPAQTAAERELAALRPALAAGPAEFLTRRGTIPGVPGLHPLMAFEVLNLVDGRRSGLDIHRYAAAQAREAGAHYFGTVAPEAVLQYLRNVEGVGLIRLR
jgi:hypothetical protein